MTYVIRESQIDDVKQIQEIARKSWHATYEGIIPLEIQNQFLSSAYNEEMLQRRISHSLFLVAEEKEKIIGFANFSPVKAEGEMELGAIYLTPEHQGKGVGGALLHKGVELSPDARKVFINVEMDNQIGKRFYEAKGFKVISEFDENFDGHVLKTVRMMLVL
ncbi:GNAT family N-acetyltransferase [Robertmurraya massiliosenegalensis]|uniref:GNAT family N-acetyltransferase n=1 Tax=Robertmurraya TaxID=2837507 RepID=UPI0039A655B0